MRTTRAARSYRVSTWFFHPSGSALCLTGADLSLRQLCFSMAAPSRARVTANSSRLTGLEPWNFPPGASITPRDNAFSTAWRAQWLEGTSDGDAARADNGNDEKRMRQSGENFIMGVYSL